MLRGGALASSALRGSAAGARAQSQSDAPPLADAAAPPLTPPPPADAARGPRRLASEPLAILPVDGLFYAALVAVVFALGCMVGILMGRDAYERWRQERVDPGTRRVPAELRLSPGLEMAPMGVSTQNPLMRAGASNRNLRT